MAGIKLDKYEKKEGSPKRGIRLDKYEKPIESEVEAATPKYSELESAGLGAVQGGSLNTADEIEGGLKAIYDDMKSLITGESVNKAMPKYDEEGRLLNSKELKGTYEDHRDAARARYDQAEKDNPKSYTAGEVTGGIASSFIPGLNVAKGANAVKKSAALAGVAGYGKSKEEELGGQLKDAAWDATIGGLLGKFFSKLGTSSDDLEKLARQKAVKSLNPILSQQESLVRKGAVDKLGQSLLDENVVKAGRSVKDIQDDVIKHLMNKGKRIGEIRQAADSDDAVDFLKLVRDAGDDIDLSRGSTTAKQTAAKRYLKEAQNLAGIKKTGDEFAQPSRLKDSIKSTQKLISDLDDDIPFNTKDMSSWTPQQKALYKTRKNLVNQIDERVNTKTPELAEEYKSLKDQFGLFKQGKEILDKSVARQDRNASLGLRDLLLGNMANKSQNSMGVQEMLVALASKLARERGNSTIAAGARTGSQVAQKLHLDKIADPLRRTTLALLMSRAKDDPKAASYLKQVASSEEPDEEMKALMSDPKFRELFDK